MVKTYGEMTVGRLLEILQGIEDKDASVMVTGFEDGFDYTVVNADFYDDYFMLEI